jgi:hypothetical protein
MVILRRKKKVRCKFGEPQLPLGKMFVCSSDRAAGLSLGIFVAKGMLFVGEKGPPQVPEAGKYRLTVGLQFHMCKMGVVCKLQRSGSGPVLSFVPPFILAA